MAKKPFTIHETQILKALEAAKGNQRAAAQTLGISQAWLVRWLQRNSYVQTIKWEKVQWAGLQDESDPI
jgi:hypothetical protein